MQEIGTCSKKTLSNVNIAKSLFFFGLHCVDIRGATDLQLLSVLGQLDLVFFFLNKSCCFIKAVERCSENMLKTELNLISSKIQIGLICNSRQNSTCAQKRIKCHTSMEDTHQILPFLQPSRVFQFPMRFLFLSRATRRQ